MGTKRLKTVHCIVGMFSAAQMLVGQPMTYDEIVWTERAGTAMRDVARGVTVDRAGNVFVTGGTAGSLGGPNVFGGDNFLLKYDTDGNLIWSQQPGGPYHDSAEAVAVDSLGNAFVAGTTDGSLTGNGAGNYDAFLMKYNVDGKLVWTRQFGSRKADFGESVAVDSGGNVYICGWAEGSLVGTSVGLADVFLFKYNTAGDLLWSRQVGTSRPDSAHGVALNPDGDAYIVGTTYRGDLGGPNVGEYDAFMIRYNSSGDLLWKRQIGTVLQDFGEDVAVDADGNAYITGHTRGSLGGPNAGDYDVFLAKFDEIGNLLWIRQFGTTLTERGRSVSIDADGNAVLASTTSGSTFAAGSGTFLIKYNGEGDLLRVHKINVIGYGNSMTTDTVGNTYMAGEMGGSGPTAGSLDAFVMKLESRCYADCDQSTGAGVMDMADFLCFQRAFVNIDSYACDCDMSTGLSVCDVFDFLCFQDAFVAGCP